MATSAEEAALNNCDSGGAVGGDSGGGGPATVSLKGMTKAERKEYKKRVKEQNQAKREAKVSKYVKNNRKGVARKIRQKAAGGPRRAQGAEDDDRANVRLDDGEEERLAEQLAAAEKGLAHFAAKDVKKGVRQTGKVEKSARATHDQVIDGHTMRVLFKWMADGFLEEMGGAIRSGKEASAFHARGNVTRMRASGGQKGKDLRAGVEHILAMREREKQQQLQVAAAAAGGSGGGSAAAAGVDGVDGDAEDEVAEVAVKIFKTTMTDFKNRAEYVEGDHRFKDTAFGKQTNQLKLCKLWAEKEFKNLSRMHSAGIRCPEPLKLKDHLLVMQFVGQQSSGTPAPQLREANLSPKRLEEAYVDVISYMYKLHQDCRLVHGDLSEYNLLYYKKQVWVIDVGQAVQLTHPHATKFLYRDIKNVTDFFCHRHIGRVMTYNQVYTFLVKQLPDHRQWELEQLHQEQVSAAATVAAEECTAAAAAAAAATAAPLAAAATTAADDDAARNTPMAYVRAKVLEALEAAGDNTSDKYKGVDDISLQGIDLRARVFGSGWKSDLQLRMNAGGNADSIDQHDAMEDLSSNAFGLEHMAADITQAERDTADDRLQQREETAAADAVAAGADDGGGGGGGGEVGGAAEPAVHKKDAVKADDEFFLKFHDLKVGMRVVVSRDETRAVQECRKCTVRSSGASTMFWGTRTEKELLRKNGLGKVAVVKELDKSDRSVRVQLLYNGKQTWYPAALMTAMLDEDGNPAEPDEFADMPDFLEAPDGSRVPLAVDAKGGEATEEEGVEEDEEDEEFDDERLQELRARKATLEAAIAELEVEKGKLPGKKNKPARQKLSKKVHKLERELEEVDFDIDMIENDDGDTQDDLDDDEEARQELVDALAALREDLAATKPSKKRDIREIKEQIADLEREIEAFDEYRALELRQAELEEKIEHGEGDVDALQDELDDVNDEMDRLEEEMTAREERSD